MEKERLITWFIFTNDSHTNKVISTEVPRENMFHGVICYDGERRDLWECDGSFVARMNRSKKDLGLHYDIYKREGKKGPIKKVTFIKTAKKRKKVV